MEKRPLPQRAPTPGTPDHAERTHANQLEVDQDYWPEEAEKVYEEIEKDSNSSEEKVLKLNAPYR